MTVLLLCTCCRRELLFAQGKTKVSHKFNALCEDCFGHSSLICPAECEHKEQVSALDE